ncbi:MAG: hypothetical protein IID36_06320 [Planctomycetes bacterium]|nr:hypothetical protein [Planctomycetota bacterium]
MEPPASRTTSRTASIVRRGAGAAAIGAAFLLYFGFVQLTLPTGSDLFSKANLVFLYTLRFGGVALALIAIGSLTGAPLVLMVDAIVCVAIGVLFILTGILMLVDGGGGLQTIINCVCGAMFMSAARRNWQDYRVCTNRGSTTGAMRTTGGQQTIDAQPRPDETPVDSYDPRFEQRYEDAQQGAAGTSLAGQLLEQGRTKGDSSNRRDDDAHSSDVPDAGTVTEQADPDPYDVDIDVESEDARPTEASTMDTGDTTCQAEAPDGRDMADDPADQTPPDGFLAAFGDEDSPKNP